MRLSTIQRTVAVVVACFIASIVLPEFWRLMFLNPSVLGARALLDPEASGDDLPAQVAVTLEGTTAIFHRGDPDYATLLSVLRAVHSTAAVDAAGPFPSATVDGRSGAETAPSELAITSLGVTSHFRFARSTSSPHYFWLRLPHLDRGGFGLPIFMDDGRLAPLVQSAAARKP